MSKHLARYYSNPILVSGQLHPARWEIFDRNNSSTECVASTHDANMAERIIGILNAGE